MKKNETLTGPSKGLKNSLFEIPVLLTFKQLSKIMGSCTVYKDKHVCTFLQNLWIMSLCIIIRT